MIRAGRARRLAFAAWFTRRTRFARLPCLVSSSWLVTMGTVADRAVAILRRWRCAVVRFVTPLITSLLYIGSPTTLTAFGAGTAFAAFPWRRRLNGLRRSGLLALEPAENLADDGRLRRRNRCR